MAEFITEQIRNLAVLGHTGAGKSTLVEVCVEAHLASVDDYSTRLKRRITSSCCGYSANKLSWLKSSKSSKVNPGETMQPTREKPD